MAIDVGVGDVFLVRPSYRLGDTVAMNVLHYDVKQVNDASTGLPAAIRVPLQPVAATLAQTFAAALFNGWKGLASSSVSMRDLALQSVYPSPRSILYTHLMAAGSIGEVDDEALPLQDSPTITKRSVFGERWGIGRTFVVGIAESAQVNGILQPDAIGKINDFADVIGAPITMTAGGYTFQFRPVLYSKPAAGGVRVTPIIDSELSDDVIKTQRRRRPGKGM